MKLKKRLIAMFMSILMITGMIMGSTVTTMADIVPEIPVTIARINVEKYLYATGEGATVPEGLTSFSWELKKVSYQPASTNATGTLGDVMTPVSLEDPTNVRVTSTSDTDYTVTIPVDYLTPAIPEAPVDKTVKTGSGIVSIPISSYNEETGTTVYKKPGVYTYSIQEISGENSSITYDPDIYYINIYVVNVVDDAKDNEPTGATTIANITSWKGINRSPDGNTTDVSRGDYVNDVTYIPNGTQTPTPEPPATAAEVTTNVTPDGDWNAENANSADGNSDENGKTAITSTADPVPGGQTYATMTIAYPFTNAMDTRDLIVSKDAAGNYATTVSTFKVTVTDGAKGSAETFAIQYYRIQQGSTELLPLTQAEADILIGGYQTAATQLQPTVTPSEGGDPIPNPRYHADTVPDTITNTIEANVLLVPGLTFRIVGLSNQATYSVEEVATPYGTQSRTATAGHRDGETGIGRSNTTPYTYTTVKEEAEEGSAIPAMVGSMVSKGIYQTPGVTTYSSGTKPESVADYAVAPGTMEDVHINYVNTRNLVTPTGIVLNMLPYIVAVVAVIAVGVLFVVVRKKKTNKGAGL